MSKKVFTGLLSVLLIFSLFAPAVGFSTTVPTAEQEGKALTPKFDNAQLDIPTDEFKNNVQFEKKPEKRTLDGFSHSLKQEKTPSGEGSAVQAENYVPLSDSKERISVIVELQSQPVKVFEKSRQQGMNRTYGLSQQLIVQREQSTFKSEATQRLNATIGRQYSTIFNGFSMTIPADQVETLLQLPGVKAVYPDNIVYTTASADNVTPMMERSAPHIGSDELWDLGITGEGVKVGIIDTGVANDHPDLADAIPDGYWGYDFVDNDEHPYETRPEDRPEDEDEYDDRGYSYWTSHGTHVAGTVAGRGIGSDGVEGVKGVAPGATIYAYRVLGPYGSGTTANVIAAIERAVDDELDVINLSLGSSSNNERSADSIAVNNAVKAGVIAVVSSGNSGPGDFTITDPGTAELAITVGASKPPLPTPLVNVEPLGEQFFMDTFDKSEGIEDLDGTYALVDVGLGDENDYDDKDLSGKIAFIQRGEFSFEEKSANAKNAGATAAIIYNNEPGPLESGTLGDLEDPIPTYALSGEDGDRIKDALDAGTEITVSFAMTEEEDIMAGFSSRGAARPSHAIKPDISAPGMGIRSSVPDFEGFYAAQNGTSMAAPHIAGAAALLKEKYSQLDQYEIKSLLMNNTVKLTDRAGNRYTHMDQGTGRVALDQLIAAKGVTAVEETTDAVADDVETTHYTGSLSFGYVDFGETDSREVVVKDIVGASSEYAISFEWYGDSAGTLTTSKDSVNVSVGGTDRFTVHLEVASDAEEKRYEGEITLTEVGGHVIHIPFAVYPGEYTEPNVVTDLAVTPNIFSPNDDGINDTADITFTINEPAGYFSLDVHDSEGGWIGTLIEPVGGIGPGSYIVPDWDGSGLPDALYLLVPWIGDSLDGAQPVADQLAPFIIDTEAPVSELNDPSITVDHETLTGTISGRVLSDLLIDELVVQGGLRYEDVIGVAAMYENEGEWKQVNGVIDDEGNFEIEVPLAFGDNEFEVYVYDLAGNGVLNPAHTVEYAYDLLDRLIVTSYPEVTNQDEVSIEGRAGPGVTVEISGGESDASGVADEETGDFQIDVLLRHNEENALQLKAVMDDRESKPIEITILHDNIAPTTPGIEVDPTGWANADAVTVTVTAGEDEGSGVDTTEYLLGDGDIWVTYNEPFNIETEGETTVYARTIDNAGNVSEEAEATVQIDRTPPELTLNGPNPQAVLVGEEYEEHGVTVTDNSGEDLSDKVEITGEVDTSTIGKYEVVYSVADLAGNEATVTRTVFVVEELQPVITLKGDNPLTLEVGTEYEEPGAEAYDEVDGDLSDDIVIEGEVNKDVVDTYEVRYNVSNSLGVEAKEAVREVRVVDATPPELELNGGAHIQLELGEPYEELGATATDNYDGDLTDDIRITGAVDHDQVGTYAITYTVQDSSGNVTVVTRIVTVADTQGPEDVTLEVIDKTATSITLGLSAHDLSGIKQYVLHRDGELIAVIDGAESEFTDSGLQPEQTYTYTVVAVDPYGNESEEVSLEVTTEEKEEVKPPGDGDDGDEENGSPGDNGENGPPTTDPGPGDNGHKGGDTESKKGDSGRTLPDTATNNYTWILIGIALIIAAIPLVYRGKRDLVG